MTSPAPSDPAPSAGTPSGGGQLVLAGPRGLRVHRAEVAGLGEVAVDVLDPVADAALMHRWFTSRGAGAWGLGHLSPEELAETYAFVDSLEAHHAFLVRVDEVPVAVLQVYEAEHDPVAATYPVQPGDVGVHLFVGAHDPRVRGWTTRLLGAVVGFVLAPPAVRRIVVEPAADHATALARAVRSGFELGPVVDVDGKRARLAWLTRERAATLVPTITAG